MPLDVRKSRDISVEYKFVIQRAGGWTEWEEGPNRNLPLKLQLGRITSGPGSGKICSSHGFGHIENSRA